MHSAFGESSKARVHALFLPPRIELEYGFAPSGWTFDVSDSVLGDGDGGDNGTSSNMAEAAIHDRTLKVYSNALPGYTNIVKDGAYLMKVRKDAWAILPPCECTL